MMMSMLEYDLEFLLRVGVATLLSSFIGWDREKGHKPAGLRTHMLVGLGSALFVVIGEILLEYFAFTAEEMRFDPLRILEAVVGGVAFLGAGTIFFARGENMVMGLTTAASLWATAAVAMAAALEHYVLAAGACFLIILILRVFNWFEKEKRN